MANKTAVILVVHPTEVEPDEAGHVDEPFAGIHVLAIEEWAEGDNYDDIIGPVHSEFPTAKFCILQI